MGSGFGDGKFEFGAWTTPFEDEHVEILDVAYATKTGELVCRVESTDTGLIYRICAETSAFRVIDEHGLGEFWAKTRDLGGRPGATTFKVKNGPWSTESPISFACSNGWSYVVATDSDCIEMIAAATPTVKVE
ncbi:hypothetical protein JQK88_30715 [Mesorhizobium caraganae]|uniref:hypothetical protein n=1 Tax=Mesorhizobium caraganae TaxID=483206 RepID=UPI0017847C11|nr:hypothetical protein [Mesorhizobium caraganae]MBM2715501.1 hypothetical protein [Mesorhizobium caraganae]